MIGIIDYGMGNLFSVSKALERLGVDYFISEDKEKLSQSTALLLPGVGSFRDAMKCLRENGLSEMIIEYAQSGKPLLGICLGMQLLFEESEENGPTEGLCLLPGKVKRFPGGDYKVPHMGWNRLEFLKESPLTKRLTSNIDSSPIEEYVYFVHSYFVDAKQSDVVIAQSSYYEDVAAIVGRANVFGMQFHPEKSGKLGMALLGDFAKLVEESQVAK